MHGNSQPGVVCTQQSNISSMQSFCLLPALTVPYRAKSTLSANASCTAAALAFPCAWGCRADLFPSSAKSAQEQDCGKLTRLVPCPRYSTFHGAQCCPATCIGRLHAPCASVHSLFRHKFSLAMCAMLYECGPTFSKRAWQPFSVVRRHPVALPLLDAMWLPQCNVLILTSKFHQQL